MVVDASAILAVLKLEPEEALFRRALLSAPGLHISPVNWFEVSIKVEKAGDADVRAFKAMMDFLPLTVVPVDEAQARLAHQAWRTYGKGRHRARLNMGDCFAYALAKSLNEPLLFKGNDFAHTDIVSAV